LFKNFFLLTLTFRVAILVFCWVDEVGFLFDARGGFFLVWSSGLPGLTVFLDLPDFLGLEGLPAFLGLCELVLGV